MSIELSGTYYGIAEAAAEIGCTVGRLRQMIRWGECEAVMISDRVWLMTEKEVKRIKSSKPSTGRPRKNAPE